VFDSKKEIPHSSSRSLQILKFKTILFDPRLISHLINISVFFEIFPWNNVEFEFACYILLHSDQFID